MTGKDSNRKREIAELMRNKAKLVESIFNDSLELFQIEDEAKYMEERKLTKRQRAEKCKYGDQMLKQYL